MTCKLTVWNWTKDWQKKAISKETLLVYPNFILYLTDASMVQLGVVVSQNNKSIAFCSSKTKSCTATERGLLSIVETLKEFKIILLAQRVYISCKKVAYKSFNTERVIR